MCDCAWPHLKPGDLPARSLHQRAGVLGMTSTRTIQAIAAMEAGERLALEMEDLIEMRDRSRKMEMQASVARDIKPKLAREQTWR